MIRVIIEREIAEGLEEFYETAIADLLVMMANATAYQRDPAKAQGL